MLLKPTSRTNKHVEVVLRIFMHTYVFRFQKCPHVRCLAKGYRTVINGRCSAYLRDDVGSARTQCGNHTTPQTLAQTSRNTLSARPRAETFPFRTAWVHAYASVCIGTYDKHGQVKHPCVPLYDNASQGVTVLGACISTVCLVSTLRCNTSLLPLQLPACSAGCDF